MLSELPTLPSSSSSYFPSTSTSTLSVDNIRDRNPGTNLEVNTHEEGVAHQIAHRIIENNVENEDDSESDKDDDEGGSKAVNTNGLNSSSMSHTIAAVPVEDEPDNSNASTENRNPLPLPLHDSLQTHPPTHALIPLESMTTINMNDINSQSTHPLSRKRKILK